MAEIRDEKREASKAMSAKIKEKNERKKINEMRSGKYQVIN